MWATYSQAARDRQGRTLAIRYLARLREATARIAPVSAPGWQSDFALGFLASHVTVGLQVAFAKDQLARFHAPWPSANEIFALDRQLIPEQMGFQPLAFRTAFDSVVKRWPMGNEKVTPVAEGALIGDRILCATLATSVFRQKLDGWSDRVDTIEKEFSRLPGRNPVLRLVWRAPATLYRYLVLRTLGETAFNVSSEQARRFALER